MKTSCFALLVCICLTGCAISQRTDIFFGMNIPGGGEVSEDQWKQFNDSIVAPRFSQGYTEYAASGKWLDPDTKQTISERTRVLTFIGIKNKVREAKLDSIVNYYMEKYQQQAVLRVDAKAKVKFISK